MAQTRGCGCGGKGFNPGCKERQKRERGGVDVSDAQGCVAVDQL